MNPFAMVAACAAVIVAGHVWSLFHAVSASAVPSGNGVYGARIALWPLFAIVVSRSTHVLRQRGVARLPVVHDHGAVLQVVDRLRLVDRLRVDPWRDRERGRIVGARRRRLVRVRRGLARAADADLRARSRPVSAPRCIRRPRRPRSRPARRAAGWPRVGRTRRCRRRRRRATSERGDAADARGALGPLAGGLLRLACQLLPLLSLRGGASARRCVVARRRRPASRGVGAASASSWLAIG